MTADRFVLIFLAVWAFLFGLFAVTNVRFEAGQTIEGCAALALGVCCVIRALR